MKKVILLGVICVLLFSCAASDSATSETPTNLPNVSTNTTSGITDISATSGGEVTNDGGSLITARGVCWSTSENPVITDFVKVETGTLGSFSSNINSLLPNTSYYLKAFATNANGTAYGNQVNFTTLASSNSSVARCDGTSPTTIVEITSPTGKKWMDRNLGASQAATASNDHKAYGCMYQWGRGNDGHASIVWTSGSNGTPINGTSTVLSTSDTPGHGKFIVSIYDPFNAKWADWRNPKNNLLWQGLSGVNNPCPTNFRLPTSTEINAEFTANGITNSTTAMSSVLKLPNTAYRDAGIATIVDTGTRGYYWSSSISSQDLGQYTLYGYFDNFEKSIRYTYRGLGMPVRCIKN